MVADCPIDMVLRKIHRYRHRPHQRGARVGCSRLRPYIADGARLRRTSDLPVPAFDAAVLEMSRAALAKKYKGFKAPLVAVDLIKMVTETPHWQFGGRANVELGAFEFGIQGKSVGSRFATDVNDVKVKPYAIVDLDARVNLSSLVGFLDETYFQVNVLNLFDKKYFGNISTQINAGGNPNFSVGSPRTVSGTLNVGF